MLCCRVSTRCELVNCVWTVTGDILVVDAQSSRTRHSTSIGAWLLRRGGVWQQAWDLTRLSLWRVCHFYWCSVSQCVLESSVCEPGKFWKYICLFLVVITIIILCMATCVFVMFLVNDDETFEGHNRRRPCLVRGRCVQLCALHVW